MKLQLKLSHSGTFHSVAALLATSFFTLSMLQAGFTKVAQAEESGACPIIERGESPVDCPWAEVARSLETLSESSDIIRALEQKTPRLSSQLRELARTPELLELWGKSINYDEYAKGTIVHPPLMDALLKLSNAPDRNERIVHAGIEHTYGYLFSNLQTPFGYKRARWVKTDIEKGLGLPSQILHPLTEQGSFLANVTALAAHISLTDHPQLKQTLTKARTAPWLHDVQKFKRNLQITRLTEQVQISQSDAVELRTDFVEFSKPLSESKNTHLLIYSLRETRGTKALPPQLITLFPVEESFVSKALNPLGLGDQKPVTTRYNAFVAGLSDSKTPLTGARKVTRGL